MKRFLFFGFLAVLFVSCTTFKDVYHNDSPEREMDEISEITDRMSLKEKVCQLFIVRLQSLDENQTPEEAADTSLGGVTSITDEMESFYSRYPCGGIILFGKDIVNPDQLCALTSDIHMLGKDEGKIIPFVYIDEEGGKVSRIAKNGRFSVPVFDDMESIAESGKTENAYNAGVTIGKYLSRYGLDVDFAPVADLDTNPRNPVIGRRAFGKNPETAAEMAFAFYSGLSENGIYGCYKHFPGHGDTRTDTHTGFAGTEKNWGELLCCEMVPFEYGIDRGIKFIMSAHISVPEVDRKKLPSTLSRKIITEKLRGELGYKGIIVSDAMEMGAITNGMNPEEAAIRAFLAGVDVILCPFGYAETADAVVDAVKCGRISEERIDASVRRLLEVKLERKGMHR